MEYFWVKSDVDLRKSITIEVLTKEELRGKKPIVRHIKLSESFETSILADYITTKTINSRYHLISDRLKELCSMYNKNRSWIPVALIDQYGKCYIYWFWKAKVIKCLSEKTEYDFDKTVKTLAINLNILKQENNFAVKTDIEKMIIVRLDLAESMLRRGYIGFELERVLTVEE